MADTGGHCLPDFVTKGVPIFLAIDNIDFLEDTPYGHGTLHGTIIVLYQEEEKDAEPINPPLAIPDKLPSTAMHNIMEVKYHDEPIIVLKPIRFTTFKMDL